MPSESKSNFWQFNTDFWLQKLNSSVHGLPQTYAELASNQKGGLFEANQRCKRICCFF